jgi:methionyl-tRNA formyltransferase
MPPSLLLLGSTDLTLSIANRMVEQAGVALAGVMSPPAQFRISYSSEPVHNCRYADMAAWCCERSIVFRPYAAAENIAQAARETGAAAALVAGWYHMVPARVRQLFPRGCIGVHASLLPRYRGGAPLNWALLNGDFEAGVSLYELTDSVDGGVLYDQRRFAIEPGDYIGDLLRKAEAVTLDMLSDTIPGILEGGVRGRPQEGSPSYSLQRQPSDGEIDWRCTSTDIARLVRSVSRPYPGARTALDGKPLIIWRARVADGAPLVHGAPGQIVRLAELPAPAVVTGSGLLLVEELEGAGGFDLDAFARCHQKRLDRVLA